MYNQRPEYNWTKEQFCNAISNAFQEGGLSLSA